MTRWSLCRFDGYDIEHRDLDWPMVKELLRKEAKRYSDRRVGAALSTEGEASPAAVSAHVPSGGRVRDSGKRARDPEDEGEPSCDLH